MEEREGGGGIRRMGARGGIERHKGLSRIEELGAATNLPGALLPSLRPWGEQRLPGRGRCGVHGRGGGRGGGEGKWSAW